MGGNSETFRSYATHPEFLDSSVSRRILLESISADTLAPTTSGSALASADSVDASSQKRCRLRTDQKVVLFPINNESLSRRVRLVKNGRVLRSFTASLGLPAQWWAHLDASDWKGQTLTLSIEPDRRPRSGLWNVCSRQSGRECSAKTEDMAAVFGWNSRRTIECARVAIGLDDIVCFRRDACTGKASHRSVDRRARCALTPRKPHNNERA